MEDQVSMGAVPEESGYIRQGGAGRTVLAVLRILVAAVIIAAAIVASGYMGLCAYAANGKTIWPGISVMGQDLGGLTVEAAALKLNNFIEESTVQLYLYDHDARPGDHERAPDYVLTLSDLGFAPDTFKIASDAYDMNVTAPEFYTLGWRYLTGEGETEFRPTLELDPEQEDIRAQEVSDALSFPVTDADYYLNGEESLTVNLPIDGRAVYPEDVRRQLDRVIASAPDFVFDIPYTVLERNRLTAEEIHEDVYIPVKNAYYDKSAGAIAPGQVSRDFNVEALQTLMDEGAPGEAVHIELTHQDPAISYSRLEAVLFRDVLGSASTHVSGSSARINNVKLAARAFNGTVLNAGDVFSYNGTVGQRTKAKGYQAAPAYVEGQTVDEIGGGVCQPSSTLYLASLRSNMQITERYAHRYVPAYIPAGMDATVSWGGPDYKFTNNTDYPVKIQTYYNPSTSYLTVTLIGTKTNDYTVKITNEFISTTPWKTVYQTDRSLPVGSTRVSVTPYTGYKYNTYRNIYDGDGKLISSKFEAVSDYKVRNQVILRNPG